MLNNVKIYEDSNGEILVVGADMFVGKLFAKYRIFPESRLQGNLKLEAAYVIPEELRSEILREIRHLPKESVVLTRNRLMYMSNLANKYGAKEGDIYIERNGKNGRESKCYQVVRCDHLTMTLREIACDIIERYQKDAVIVPHRDEWVYNERIISAPTYRMSKYENE